MAEVRGFVPFKSMSGVVSPRAIRFNTRAANRYQIRVGDLVTLQSAAAGAAVDRLEAEATAATNCPLGVAVGIYNQNGRPYTFAQPDAGPYVPVSTSGYVEVLTDPNQTYLVECESTLSAGAIGLYVAATMGAPNTACGISGFKIAQKTATITNAVDVTAGTEILNPEFQCQIISYPKFGDDDSFGAVEGEHPDQMAEVRLVNLVYGPGGHRRGN